MRMPAGDLTYHATSFGRRDEAAAFIAALSRFLDSLRGSAFMARATPPEVWSHLHPAATGDAVEVYLDEGALDAATTAFAPVHVTGTHRGEALPPDCVLMIGGQCALPWGLADVEGTLTRG